MRELAEVICKLDPDIASMQEVYDCNIMNDLIVALRIQGCSGYRPYLVKGTDTATQQNVALITRVDPVSNIMRTSNRFPYPLPGNTCDCTGSSCEGTYGVSKHFYADFDIQGDLFTLFNFHFLVAKKQNLLPISIEFLSYVASFLFIYLFFVYLSLLCSVFPPFLGYS